MAAIGAHHTATTDEAWDGPANEARLRTGESESYYRSAYAWQDPEGDPEAKAAYKFIHHMVDGDGNVGAANIRACQTGIGVLNGARGGTTIPSGDRRGVWHHLAAHMQDADVEPPALRAGPRPLALGHESRAWPMAELRVEETDQGPRIDGHAAVFNVLSDELWGFREIVEPGAFRDVLGQDVRALWQHDPRYVLGRTKNGTLRLAEDERGLKITAFPPDTSWAQDALLSMRRGDVDQMSFGFDVGKDHWAENDDGVIIRRIISIDRLYDVAPVTFPAYPQTSVQVRSVLAAAGIDFEGLMGVIYRSRAGLDLRREEQALVREMIDWLRELLPEPELHAGRGVAELDVLRRRLELAQRH